MAEDLKVLKLKARPQWEVVSFVERIMTATIEQEHPVLVEVYFYDVLIFVCLLSRVVSSEDEDGVDLYFLKYAYITGPHEDVIRSPI
ncbi:hypothetical protein SNE40_020935 [Patella caerulea]|uniref:Uncharacterized protein n=1 Tax=Patella caerulea TaxID=87958 RepID=A0AAN8IXP3_PATCE